MRRKRDVERARISKPKKRKRTKNPDGHVTEKARAARLGDIACSQANYITARSHSSLSVFAAIASKSRQRLKAATGGHLASMRGS